MDFQINNSRKTTDLLNKAVSWLRTSFNYDSDDKFINVEYRKNDGIFAKLEKDQDLKTLFENSAKIKITLIKEVDEEPKGAPPATA